MAVSFSLKLIGKDLTAELSKRLNEDIAGELQKGADSLVLKAKQLAPVDMGGLQNAISAPVKIADLQFQVSVNVFYAAFIEWGTGKYAAKYVSTLPADWQEYARSFKGKKGSGSLDQFLDRMIEWVKRKGIHGTTKSGRSRTGKKADEDAYNIAYVIVIRILQNGIKPHPFLYPAYEYARPIIIEGVESAFKKLGQ